jgi:flagellar motility protein MotE (MotC chaperone)
MHTVGKIILRRENVVKETGSEDTARALEAKGFIRYRGDSGKGAAVPTDTEQGKTEQELQDARANLKAAEKKIAGLTQELEGTREQLEAAIKKNTAGTGKKEKGGSGR